MPNVPLTFACGAYDRMLPLFTGEVKPAGIDLNFLDVASPREIFDRMVAKQEFDASEMSSSEYIQRFAAGECPFVALPVFPSRMFRHGFIAVDTRVIKTPADLAGKRIGVQLYTMSAAIWIRGLLQHQYGVDLSAVQWIEGALNEAKPHGNPTVLPLLKPVSITANKSGKSLSDLLEAGEIAATIGADLPAACGKNPHISRLFPDFREQEKDYYRRLKIFPIMHLVVIRRDVYERHPVVAENLYEAFCESKARARARMRYVGALRYMLPWLPSALDEIDEVFGGDPWPYGIAPNRPTLEALVSHLHEQSLIATKPRVDDLFVPLRSQRS